METGTIGEAERTLAAAEERLAEVERALRELPASDATDMCDVPAGDIARVAVDQARDRAALTEARRALREQRSVADNARNLARYQVDALRKRAAAWRAGLRIEAAKLGPGGYYDQVEGEARRELERRLAIYQQGRLEVRRNLEERLTHLVELEGLAAAAETARELGIEAGRVADQKS